MDTAAILFILEIVGTAAFAVSGALTALKKQSDVFGVVFLGVISATGGGVLRDVFLAKLPPKAFTDPVFVITAAAISIVVFIITYLQKEPTGAQLKKIDSVNNIFDALGLGVFTVTGINAVFSASYIDNIVLALILGMLTGVGGGMIRDTLLGEIPFVLTKKIYAVASLGGGMIYYLFIKAGIDPSADAFCGIIFVFVLRMLATFYRWDLPRIQIKN